MRFRVLLGLGLIVAISASLSALSVGDDAEEGIDFEKILCPVSKKPVDESAKTEHDDCDVYFCCKNCLAAFDKDPTDFLARANHQKVATKQVKQIKCPKTKGKIKESTALDVSDVDVMFCCKNCRGWAKGLSEDVQFAKLFDKDVFEEAFEVIEKEDDDDES